jgi:hypothetical protein
MHPVPKLIAIHASRESGTCDALKSTRYIAWVAVVPSRQRTKAIPFMREEEGKI